MKELVFSEGQRFGRLTIVGKAEKGKNGVLWLCRCDCGKETKVLAGNIKKDTRSCGCLKIDQFKKRVTTHGKSKTKIYKVWRGIMERCFYLKHKSYMNYGGRGITVSDEWQEFEQFYDWAMANGYGPGVQIDRINNDGNYEPGNCRWVTPRSQANNKRTTTFFLGKPLSEWCIDLGLKSGTIRMRIHRGWPLNLAINTPTKRGAAGEIS